MSDFPIKKKWVLWVVFCHLFFVLLCMFNSFHVKKPLLVKSVHFKPRVEKPISFLPKTEPKKEAVNKELPLPKREVVNKALPLPKKETKKIAQSVNKKKELILPKREKTEPKVKEPQASQRRDYSNWEEEALMQRLEKTISNLESDSVLSKQPISTEVVEETEEAPWEERLALELKNLLSLPEYGEVKARLTLSSFGEIMKVEVLEAKSEKNALYLKKTLSTLAFPWLNLFLENGRIKTVMINFTNE